MVSSVNSVNKYPANRESLEVARRLQSLGLVPSGNLSIDRQRLQNAEIKKRQSTLASNSEINLSKLEGTKYDFSSTIASIKDIKTSNISTDQEIGLTKNNNNSQQFISNNDVHSKMLGALQIAELNKLKLGLIA